VCGSREPGGDVESGVSVRDGTGRLGDTSIDGDGAGEALAVSDPDGVAGVGEGAPPMSVLDGVAVDWDLGGPDERRFAATAIETATRTTTRADATARDDRHRRLTVTLRILARSMTFVCPSDLEL
jgi:hypothetical protein